MFSPPKLKTIIFSLLTTLVAFSSTVEGQQAEYNRRMAAMQQARARAQVAPRYDEQVRVASGDVGDESGFDYAAPPAPPTQRTANATRRVPDRSSARPQRSSTTRPPQRVAQAPRRITTPNQTTGSNRVARRFVPPHTRLAQLTEDTVIGGGGPIVTGDGPLVAPGIVSGCTGPGCTSPGCASCGNTGPYETIIDGGYVDEGYIVDGCADDCCGSCGDSCGYFECGSCCDPGGCPPGPCWLSGLGGILRNGSYYGGAVGFENPIFRVPGTDILIQDSNFGYYGGFNLGWPLCRLTCGVLSAQIGVNSVQTNLNGNQYTINDRDQTFLTLGVYRRVDCGLQAGMAVDYLRQNWYADTESTQLRGDLGWVYPNGTTFGFRFGANVNDSSATLDISDEDRRLQVRTQDWYKFYLRRETMERGLSEFFLGWTDNSQGVLGMEFDVPIAERVALQAGYTYFLNSDQRPPVETYLGGNESDAWNISVGLAFRPQGRCYYQSYDRPLFNVADNGSMMIDRGPLFIDGDGDNGDGDGGDGGDIDQEL
jgi:hypothetical protein